MKKTPIALFAYNRPRHIALALETLAGCDRFKECDLYIFCDGPKRLDQKQAVEATRIVVRDWADRLKANVVEREQNLGLACSISTGVTELCNTYGRVIVVEDDHALRPDFIDYMLQALDRYEECNDVYQISGYMFPVDHPTSPDAFFLPLTTTWGWATWERAWKIFDWNAHNAIEKLTDDAIRRQFDLDDAYPFAEMLKKRLSGDNESWGILWWWSVWQVSGLVLHPRKSLVWVGGFDGTGTHCGIDTRQLDYNETFIQTPALSYPITLPDTIYCDTTALSKVRNHLKEQKDKGRKIIRTLLKVIASIRHMITK